jgi:hypothetical protein
MPERSSIQHQPHEGEERDRQQHLVRHGAEDAVGQGLQERPGERDGVGRVGSKLHRDEEEQQSVCRQGEGDRIAEEKEDHERREHDRREVLGNQCSH